MASWAFSFCYFSWGDECDESDDSDAEGDVFHIGSERLEEDEELRLYILGVKSFWTKFMPY